MSVMAKALASAVKDAMMITESPKLMTSEKESELENTSAKRSQANILQLLRESPYVGFCRHAPPSPVVKFAKKPTAVNALPTFELLEGEESETPEAAALPGSIADELWATIFNYVAEVPLIPVLARVDTGFNKMLCHAAAWKGRRVIVPTGALQGLAPVLDHWLAAWELASKMVIPRSTQLLSEVNRRAPQLAVEVAWRFDTHSKGEGVQVIRDGASVRRTDVEDVVVLGDAPLVVEQDRPAFMEVRLDELDDVPAGDGLNDFGIGVTACAPEEIEDLGAVADEVPCSWIVDFSKTSVCLSVNNNLETKGVGISASKLANGDRVGVRITPKGDAVEVFINGQLCETLKIPAMQHIPASARLYPVLDLYGRAVQVSCTGAREPHL